MIVSRMLALLHVHGYMRARDAMREMVAGISAYVFFECLRVYATTPPRYAYVYGYANGCAY